MTPWAQHLVPAVQALRAAGVADPARDARLLLAHAAGVSPDRLTLHLGDPAPQDAVLRFQGLIARRAAREPVSHLIGQRLFWGRSFAVTPAVLDPRPETEGLIAAALDRPFARVLDLGLGSGCILLTLLAECPDATGVGVDLSAKALAVATVNAATLGVQARADLRQGNWFDPVTGRFDLIVSNPPYIAQAEMAGLAPEVALHEPRMALTDEADGLTAYRILAAGALGHLAPGGRLLVEIGPTQGQAVAGFFAAAGLLGVQILADMDGRDRIVVGHAR